MSAYITIVLKTLQLLLLSLSFYRMGVPHAWESNPWPWQCKCHAPPIGLEDYLMKALILNIVLFVLQGDILVKWWLFIFYEYYFTFFSISGSSSSLRVDPRLLNKYTGNTWRQEVSFIDDNTRGGDFLSWCGSVCVSLRVCDKIRILILLHCVHDWVPLWCSV